MNTSAHNNHHGAAGKGGPSSGPSFGPLTVLLLGIFITLSAISCDQLTHIKSGKSKGSTQLKPLNFTIPPGELHGHRYIPLRPTERSQVYLWWDQVPASVSQQRLEPPLSNVNREDYAGAESCMECHKEQYNHWLDHPHRRMNALANEENVVGDFSGEASINYLGGTGSFYRKDGQYQMELVRGPKQRVYAIRRTLGSRFFQYYIGRQIKGPEPFAHRIWHRDHVLPFGYWIDHKMWVPVVHIEEDERPDGQRNDPYNVPLDAQYDQLCSACHTTLPAVDRMLSFGGLTSYLPRSLSIFASAHLAKEHPYLVNPEKPFTQVPQAEIQKVLLSGDTSLLHQKNALNLGISCEACHNGCADHVSDSDNLMPKFFPSGQHVFTTGRTEEEVYGRTPDNLNWACARCHIGGRPTYAGGMHTWNSTEFTDAANGHCYNAEAARDHDMNPLTCVTCHDPHKGIGSRWEVPKKITSSKCIDCHGQFSKPAALAAHTHHSEAVGCMDCHMPKINEGLQDLVRTHRIFSPTEPKMIEANQPNACNLCHLEKSIDWTMDHLSEWYENTEFSQVVLDVTYKDRKGPVGLEWLASKHEPTRLVGASALLEAKATWALPQLIGMLDDPYLLNRQFTQRGLERMLNIRLEDHGYRFYMTPQERAKPIEQLRATLLKQSPE